MGSFTSSKLEKSGLKFKINVIEPIEIDDAKPLRTLDFEDFNNLQNADIDEEKHSRKMQGKLDPRLMLINAIKERKKRQNESVIKLQKLVRGYIARKDYKWKLKCKKNKKKIYHRILYCDGNYHLIQGFLTHQQDIIIVVFDVSKHTSTQELNVSKREYMLMMDDSMGMNSVLPSYLDSSRSASAFKNINIDQVDFNYLIDKHLNYDEIVQCFIFNNRQRDSPNPYGKDMVHTATLDQPMDSNVFLSRQFGTSRGSFITESITGTSLAYRLTSGVLGPTTFARSSDTNKSESEEEKV